MNTSHKIYKFLVKDNPEFNLISIDYNDDMSVYRAAYVEIDCKLLPYDTYQKFKDYFASFGKIRAHMFDVFSLIIERDDALELIANAKLLK